MTARDESSISGNETNHMNQKPPSGDGMSPMAVHFLIVGILFLVTVLVWGIYFYIQYTGIQNWRECFGGARRIRGFGTKRTEGTGISSVSGWMHQNEVKRQAGGSGMGSSSTGRTKFTATKLKPSMNSRL